MQLSTRNLKHLIFQFGFQNQEIPAKCLSKANIHWTAARIRQFCKKKCESSTAAAKHVKHQPESQLQGHINQLRNQRINLPLHKKCKKRKQPYHTRQAGPSQSKQNSMPSAKKQFKQPQTIRFHKTTAITTIKSCQTVPNVDIPSTD